MGCCFSTTSETAGDDAFWAISGSVPMGASANTASTAFRPPTIEVPNQGPRQGTDPSSYSTVSGSPRSIAADASVFVTASCPDMRSVLPSPKSPASTVARTLTRSNSTPQLATFLRVSPSVMTFSTDFQLSEKAIPGSIPEGSHSHAVSAASLFVRALTRTSTRLSVTGMHSRTNTRCSRGSNSTGVTHPLLQVRLPAPDSSHSLSDSNRALGHAPSSWFPSFRRVNVARVGADRKGARRVNDYVIVRKLGTGRYGEVFLVQHAGSFVSYAMKQVHRSTGKRSEGVQGEVDILMKLRHPNVVRLFEVIDDPTHELAFMIFEYVEGGPVMELAEDGKAKEGPIQAQRLRSYVEQTLTGLQYLHGANVVHRDVKPENILVTNKDVIKIADLGVGRVLHTRDDTMRTTEGTPMFFSPEACKGETTSAKCGDVWALGVTIYIMVYAVNPFYPVRSQAELFERIQRHAIRFPPLPECAKHARHEAHLLKSLLSRMLDRNPLRRITLSEALASAWVRGTDEPLPSAEMSEVLSLGRQISSFPTPMSEGQPAVETPETSEHGSCRQFAVATSATCISVLIAEEVFIMQKMFIDLLRQVLLPDVELLVQCVSNGPGAVESCSATRFDLVLMDLHIEGISGVVATGRIRLQEAESGRPQSNIVGVTDECSEEVASLCAHAGMNAVLVKPVTTADLAMICRQIGAAVRSFESSEEDHLEARVDTIAERYNSFIQCPRPVIATTSLSGSTWRPPSGAPSPSREVQLEVSEGEVDRAETVAASPRNTGVRAALGLAPVEHPSAHRGLAVIEPFELALGACTGALIKTYYGDLGWARAARMGPAAHVELRLKIARTLPSVLVQLDSGPEVSSAVPLLDLVGAFEALEWWPAVAATPPMPAPPSRYEAFAFAEQGRRLSMEDHYAIVLHPTALFTAEPPGPPGEELIVGVFDGHGGAEAAAYCSRALPAAVGMQPTFTSDPVAALTTGFAACSDAFLRKSVGNAGTTACVALLRGSTLTVANLGDSRAVLSSKRGVQQLTRLHVATDEEERKQVEARGGEIMYISGCWRVDGILAVTRSIGDRHVHKHLSQIPDLHTHEVTPDDEFLIIASDGLWDVMTPEEAAGHVRQVLSELAALKSDVKSERHSTLDGVRSTFDGAPPTRRSSRRQTGASGCSGTDLTRTGGKLPSVIRLPQSANPVPAAGIPSQPSSYAPPQFTCVSEVSTCAAIALDTSIVPETLCSEALERGSKDNVACVVVVFHVAEPPGSSLPSWSPPADQQCLTTPSGSDAPIS
eukprot:TRINITY_DN4538_c0_g1_i1.p1 TRINITY_DN4538_c0_g1~~TRINITY_DN4538_c0_g1_i1.p1  ORF type:complete len:1279 (+),score=195.56 TRINITY_DN4538_c0_g1_i1:77-3913(+)